MRQGHLPRCRRAVATLLQSCVLMAQVQRRRRHHRDVRRGIVLQAEAQEDIASLLMGRPTPSASSGKAQDEPHPPVQEGEAAEVTAANVVSEEQGALASFLRKEVGLTDVQLEKVESFWASSGGRVPDLALCRDVVSYLTGAGIALPMADVAKVLADCPVVLNGFSLIPLQEKILFLESEASMTSEMIAALLEKYPQILQHKLANMRQAKDFWTMQVGLSESNFGSTLLRVPTVLMTQTEVLQSKWMFANDVMGLDLEEVLAIRPSFFRMSLDKIVAPRHFFALQQETSLPRGEDLSQALSCSDGRFNNVVGCESGEYQRWLKEDWPYSENARTVAWLMPRKSKGTKRSSSAVTPQQQPPSGQTAREPRRAPPPGGPKRRMQRTRSKSWESQGKLSSSAGSWEWSAGRSSNEGDAWEDVEDIDKHRRPPPRPTEGRDGRQSRKEEQLRDQRLTERRPSNTGNKWGLSERAPSW